MSISSFALQQNFNVKNAMASHMQSELLRVRKETIRASFEVSNYEEHRMEEVLKINGVQYINDAKAISVNATFYSLECLEMPVIWLVTGTQFPVDYHALLPLVREKVKAIICLCDESEAIAKSFGNVIDHILEVQTLDEAVQLAYKIADAGEAILLSPSTDKSKYFKDFNDLGSQFKSMVRNL